MANVNGKQVTSVEGLTELLVYLTDKRRFMNGEARWELEDDISRVEAELKKVLELGITL